MIASVLMAKSTTAVMTIATGVFIVTSLLRIDRPSFRVENEPTLNVRDRIAKLLTTLWDDARCPHAISEANER